MENHLKTSGEHLEFKNREQIVSHQEMSDECKEVFHAIKIRKKHRFVIFKMGDMHFDVEYASAKSEVIKFHT